MKSFVFVLLTYACGTTNHSPNQYDPYDSPKEFFQYWEQEHTDIAPPQALRVINKLFHRSMEKNINAAKIIAINLNKLEYIYEMEKTIERKNGDKVLGLCHSINGEPLYLEVLSREGFEPFNKEYFESKATEQTLDNLEEMVWLHEFGHCAGGLEHASADNPLIMSAYVGPKNVTKYMNNKMFYIDQLIMTIGKSKPELFLDIDSDYNINEFDLID